MQGAYSKKDIQEAVDLVVNKNVSEREAGKLFIIPKITQRSSFFLRLVLQRPEPFVLVIKYIIL